MALISKDTIAALATAPLPAGVGVIRLSGKDSRQIVNQMCRSFGEAPVNHMHYGKLVSRAGEVLDECLMVFFENPNSFTGEDVVEVHCHGGKAVVDGLLADIFSYNGEDGIVVRHAEAGEFSHRAFLNGKMDLTGAEAVADLIAAETEEQKKQALRQMKGELGQRFDVWREKIMHMLAHTEAAIDFPDEELDVLEEAGLKNKLEGLISDLSQAVNTDAGQRLRDGFNVAIVGEPNAGKSTLTNLLTGRQTAIVSDIAGTTRDVVETHLNVDGFPIILADTAGLRETDDVIEQIGVGRAKEKAAESDLVIVVADGRKWPEIGEEAKAQLKKGASIVVLSRGGDFELNRLVDFDVLDSAVLVDNQNVKCIGESVVGGEKYPALVADLTDTSSVDVVLSQLAKLVREKFGQAQGAAQLTRERHKKAVNDAIAHLNRAKSLYENPHEAYSVSELLAQDFRDAAASIGSVTGSTDSEDVLDLVFSTFCIGK